MHGNIKRLGIMGGTFDPIHYGHLVTAEAIRTHFNLDKVIFVPSGHPPHKDNKKVANPVDRYLMTVLATTTNPYFETSNYEVEKETCSHTIDTLRFFKEELGKDIDLYFITGADAILDIETWKDYKELIDLCTFIAATRPGFDLRQFDKTLSKLSEDKREKFVKFEVPALAISSTDIRSWIKQKKSIKYLVPEPVEFHIFKNGLYLD